MKIGDFVEFKGTYDICYGYIVRINDNSIDYVRDTLTRWNASKPLIERGNIIDKTQFIEQVKQTAKHSHFPIPTDVQIENVLIKFKDDFECEQIEIFKILNINASCHDTSCIWSENNICESCENYY